MVESVKKYPIRIVDVGASGGIDRRWNKIPPIEPILFEPDPREFERLKKSLPSHYTVLQTALADEEKEVNFYLCKKQQVSSCFKPNREVLNNFSDAQRFDIEKTIKIKTSTLDSQLQKNDITEVEFIKLDIQGLELPVLKGSEKTLEGVIGLEVEVEFLELYENQPLFEEVNRFICQQGFTLYDLRRYFWKRVSPESLQSRTKGQLVFGEALYFKNPEFLSSKEDFDAIRLSKAMTVYDAYGYFDTSISLLQKALKKEIISKEQYSDYYKELKKNMLKNHLPEFFGKGKIHFLLKELANKFSPKSWYCGTDDILGNK